MDVIPQNVSAAASAGDDVVDASALTSQLAAEVESRDDDDDWEEEGFNKQSIVTQLCSMPVLMGYVVSKDTAHLRFSLDTCATVCDIAVGITADLTGNGIIVALNFDLAVSAAAGRLTAHTTQRIGQAGTVPLAQPQMHGEEPLETVEGVVTHDTVAVTPGCPGLALQAGVGLAVGRRHVSGLVANLVSDVESRDDENDWTEEGLIKSDIVKELRALPDWADHSHDHDTTFLCFKADGEIAVSVTAVAIDISVGVVAERVPDGRISVLRFAHDSPMALQRLEAITSSCRDSL